MTGTYEELGRCLQREALLCSQAHDAERHINFNDLIGETEQDTWIPACKLESAKEFEVHSPPSRT